MGALELSATYTPRQPEEGQFGLLPRMMIVRVRLFGGTLAIENAFCRALTVATLAPRCGGRRRQTGVGLAPHGAPPCSSGSFVVDHTAADHTCWCYVHDIYVHRITCGGLLLAAPVARLPTRLVIPTVIAFFDGDSRSPACERFEIQRTPRAMPGTHSQRELPECSVCSDHWFGNGPHCFIYQAASS